MVVAFAIIILSGNLSAQVVTSGADDGTSGTLRQEILDASPGDIITFAVGVSTVTLNSEIEIDKDITISGGLVLNNTIDANGNGRIFNITSGSVILDDLNLINGVEAGGVIEDNSGAGLSIEISNTDFEMNNAGVSPATAALGNGGAIHITGVAMISIETSEFFDNSAANEGGALWNQVNSTMNVYEVTVNSNTAADGGGV